MKLIFSGITNQTDLDLVLNTSAWGVGFDFEPNSRQFVAEDFARTVPAQLTQHQRVFLLQDRAQAHDLVDEQTSDALVDLVRKLLSEYKHSGLTAVQINDADSVYDLLKMMGLGTDRFPIPVELGVKFDFSQGAQALLAKLEEFAQVGCYYFFLELKNTNELNELAALLPNLPQAQKEILFLTGPAINPANLDKLKDLPVAGLEFNDGVARGPRNKHGMLVKKVADAFK